MLKRSDYPVLVRPNLGQPDFIHPKNITISENQLESLPKTLKFGFEGLIATRKHMTISEICEAVDNKLFIYPLGEKIINGRAERLESITILIKELKPTKIIDIDEDEYCGNPQKYLESEDAFPDRNQFFFVTFQFEVPSEIFFKEDLFSYSDTKQKIRDMVLCDIVYDLNVEDVFSTDSVDSNYLEFIQKSPTTNYMRVNYHSLVLTLKNKEESTDIKFWQATDLHIAKQNDEIPFNVINKIQKKGMRKLDEDYSSDYKKVFDNSIIFSYSSDEYLKNINNRLEDKESYIFSPSEIADYDDDNFFWNLPVEYRLQNFNNNLRMLIYQANEAYKRDELDFIVLTGDLVDYTGIKGEKGNEYVNSNWKTFIDILLGKPLKNHDKLNEPLPGLLKPEEILVPILCIPGNHDYIGHDISPGLYPANYGLEPDEMDLISSGNLLLNFRALISNVRFLRGYFQYLNPDLNFAKKFGKTHLIFIDSDKNSLLDFYDILKGSPSTRGFRDSQIKWLRNYCDQNVKDDENIIILSHAPPLNIPKLEIVRHTIEKIYPEIKKEDKKNKTDLISMDLLKEHKLIEKFDDPRIDPIVDLKFGTIMNNWEEMIELLLNCRGHGIDKRVNLVLCGHAHKNLEFRIELLQGRELSKVKYVEYFPFYKVKIPAAVYYGNFSEEYDAQLDYLNKLESGAKIRKLADRNLIINKYPFIIQTSSLGPRSTREQSHLQGFREILINNNRIDSFYFIPILKYFVPFEKFLR